MGFWSIVTAQLQTLRRPGVVGARPEIAREASPRPTEADRSEQVLWAVETLNALSDLQFVDRRALQLMYWRGLTQAQVAANSSCPNPPSNNALRAECLNSQHVSRPPRGFRERLVVSR